MRGPRTGSSATTTNLNRAMSIKSEVPYWTCIFCLLPFGPDRPDTREHIWSEWMRDILGRQQSC